MQQNINPHIGSYPYQQVPAMNPNAVNINIIQPQAYGASSGANSNTQGFYPLYQTNQNPNLPLYPINYNNLIQYPNGLNGAQQQYPIASGVAQQYPAMANGVQQQYFPAPNTLQQPYITSPYGISQPNDINAAQDKNTNSNNANAYSSANLIKKTANPDAANSQTISKETESTNKTEKKDKNKKQKTLLTDNYIKSLENYLNDANPKVRLIAAKEVMERFKEDDSRISNPSLNALLNKMLRDTSPSVRFLGLTTLQLGYSMGNDETVGILKEILANNQDKLGEDSLLASEILLKLSAPKVKEVE